MKECNIRANVPPGGSGVGAFVIGTGVGADRNRDITDEQVHVSSATEAVPFVAGIGVGAGVG